MSKLFSPLVLGPAHLDNRIIVSPMSQYMGVDGVAGDWHKVHYGALANSGAAAVIIESTHVNLESMGTVGCLGLFNDSQEAAITEIVSMCHELGRSKIGLQLNHSGRKASMTLPWAATRGPLAAEDGAWETVSASAVPFGASWPTPRAATPEDLEATKADYIAAAKRAARAGVDILEIHAAHGYFLHSFISPIANARSDQYGGSLENRLRYPLEVFEAVRAAWPADRPLGVKVSSTDWGDGEAAGIEDALAFVRALEQAGCSYVCMSSGAINAEIKVPVAPGYQTQFAKEAKATVGMPVWAVGLIYDPNDAEQIVSDGTADAVALARAFLDNPHWAYRAASILGAEVARPNSYLKSGPAAWPGARKVG